MQLDDVEIELVASAPAFGYNAFATMTIYNDRDMLTRTIKQAESRVDVLEARKRAQKILGRLRHLIHDFARRSIANRNEHGAMPTAQPTRQHLGLNARYGNDSHD